jgi:ribosomal-protein-alanine N-acetyltransferase
LEPIHTSRLVIRKFTVDDAGFILELLNQPSFYEHIGDRGVRTRDQAILYLWQGPMSSYHVKGWGLFCVMLEDQPIGMCGLIQRTIFDDPDLGFAFLPQYWGHGYAYEACHGVIEYSREFLELPRLLAIVSPDNATSLKLLDRLGFVYRHRVRMDEDQPDIKLFQLDLQVAT